MISDAIGFCPEISPSFIIVQDEEYGAGIAAGQDGLRFCLDGSVSRFHKALGLICSENGGDCHEDVSVPNICEETVETPPVLSSWYQLGVCPSDVDLYCFVYHLYATDEPHIYPTLYPCLGTDPSDGFDMISDAIRDCPEALFGPASIVIQDEEYGGGIAAQEEGGLLFCVSTENINLFEQGRGMLCTPDQDDCVEMVRVPNICNEDIVS